MGVIVHREVENGWVVYLSEFRLVFSDFLMDNVPSHVTAPPPPILVQLQISKGLSFAFCTDTSTQAPVLCLLWSPLTLLSRELSLGDAVLWGCSSTDSFGKLT